MAERCTGNSPCTYTYIHLSRAVNLSDVANTCFLPSHRVRIFLLRVASGARAPSAQPPHSLAAASLASGCCSAWGEITACMKACSQECLCCIHSYSRATQCYEMTNRSPRALLVKHVEGRMWWACGGHAMRNPKGIWQRRDLIATV